MFRAAGLAVPFCGPEVGTSAIGTTSDAALFNRTSASSVSAPNMSRFAGVFEREVCRR